MKNVIVGFPVLMVLVFLMYLWSLLPPFVYAIIGALLLSWLVGAVVNRMRQNLIDAVEGEG